jgi:lipopolysaccharide/colanic/teichoic acid biosynthesis glycosyltransferase
MWRETRAPAPRELLVAVSRRAGGGARPVPRTPDGSVAKRLLDIVGASLALVVTAPLQLLVAVVVAATSPGGPLFRQTRVGKDERLFTMLKFRTMRADSDDGPHRDYVSRLLSEEVAPVGGPGRLYKLGDDPRVTPVGRFLRRSSLDELPQLVNVLRGEMSLVGPRPVLPWEAQLISPPHRARFRVRPGMTGMWQTSGRSHVPMREAFEMDVRYVEEQSLRLDLLILLRTVPAVLGWGGAR